MKIAIVICLMCIAASARGQYSDDASLLASPFHAGVRIDYLRDYYNIDAEILSGCPLCGTFSNGNGSGYQIELFGEVPFNFYRRLNLTFRLGLADRGGNFG